MRKLALVLGLIVASLLAAGCAQNESSATKEAQPGGSALMALADSHLAGYANSLRVLAATEEVQSGDWQRMVGLLRKAHQDALPATVWYVRPDGSYATIAQGPQSQTLADRPYFPILLIPAQETKHDIQPAECNQE